MMPRVLRHRSDAGTERAVGDRSSGPQQHAPPAWAAITVLVLAVIVAIGMLSIPAPVGHADLNSRRSEPAMTAPASEAAPAAATLSTPAPTAPGGRDAVLPAAAFAPQPPRSSAEIASEEGSARSQAVAGAVTAILPDSLAIERTHPLHPDPIGALAHRGVVVRDGLSAGGAGTQAAQALANAVLPPGSPEEQAINAQTIASGGLLPAHRILTYYGHPHDPNMGILGEYPKEELLQLLRAEAASYEVADPTRPVIVAFEVIATVAQGWPATDGTYLLDTDLETLNEYADFAATHGTLMFLDLQIGRNTVPAEMAKVRSLLERPHIHLALDPEFAIADGQVPGTHIGELTAEQIRGAQEELSRIVRDYGLPPKILVVHQFREDMILGKERLSPVPGVQLVIESDGFGPPGLKTEVYNILIRNNETEYSGIKHFYRQDVPLMTAAETLALEPAPLLIIYQ